MSVTIFSAKACAFCFSVAVVLEFAVAPFVKFSDYVRSFLYMFPNATHSNISLVICIHLLGRQNMCKHSSVFGSVHALLHTHIAYYFFLKITQQGFSVHE